MPNPSHQNLGKLTDRECKQCGEAYIGRGNSRYCSSPCLHMNQYEANMLKPEWRIKRLLGMAKNRAKTKGLPFNLDLDYLLGLWEENDGCCEISGIPIELGRSEKGKTHPYAPSLDRITPDLGYTKGNVRIICYQMNIALSEFGLEQFEEFIQLYLRNSGVSYRS